MKKLFSLTAAAIIAGSISLNPMAFAGSVTTKGNTQAQLYGFAYAEFAWDKQATNIPDLSNMPMPDANNSSSPLYKSTYNETNTSAESFLTRLGLKFTNNDANLKGKIEGDFKGKSGNGKGNFRLRQAWVEHKLNVFNILVGQAYILEEMHPSISLGDVAPAGFNIPMHRVPLVKIGTKIDVGSANLDLALAFEWSNSKAATSGKDTKNTTLSVDRYVFPTTAARAVLHLETGFGSPAMIYAWGSLIPVYISDKTGANVSDESETGYGFGAGFRLPISMFKIGFNYNHTDGATGYTGLTNYQPASYYLSSTNDVEKTTADSYNMNLTVRATDSIAVGAEYNYVKFDNDIFPSDPKTETLVGNIKIKTTKVTSLGIEWRHIKAKDFDVVGAGDDDFSGDQIYAIYKYMF